MKFIHIFKDGKMDEIDEKNLNDKKINDKKLIKSLNKISISQGNGDIKKIYTWEYNSDIIMCYGWHDGEHGFENTHKLPNSGKSDFIEEDSSLKTIYGDIFILKYKKGEYQDINISDYSVFYSSNYGDYSNYDSDDENIDSCNDSDEEIKDDLTEDYEIISNCLTELDYDTNEY